MSIHDPPPLVVRRRTPGRRRDNGSMSGRAGRDGRRGHAHAAHLGHAHQANHAGQALQTGDAPSRNGRAGDATGRVGDATGRVGDGRQDNRRQLATALGLILALMAAEVVVGAVAHSLALLSDAAHMLTDAAALGLALAAAAVAARPAKGALTFGLRRIEILSGLVNATLLLVLAGAVVFEAVRRLLHPGMVDGPLVAAVAVAGIGVNLLATWQLAGAERRSLNIRASYAHILTDLYAFIATAVAAVVIIATHFERADAIASLPVAALMLHASWGLLREAIRVLLEAAPEGMDVREIGENLEHHACVTNVHDLHVWEITSGFPALAAHVLVRPGDDCHAVREELEGMLRDRFGIDHTTLQVDHDQRGRLLNIQERPSDLPTRPEERSSGP